MAKVVIALGSDYQGVIFAYASKQEAEEDILHKCRELSEEDKEEARKGLQLVELEF